ncbi:MAG: hypothetical protein QM482_02390 [Sulfurospirillum sp.]
MQAALNEAKDLMNLKNKILESDAHEYKLQIASANRIYKIVILSSDYKTITTQDEIWNLNSGEFQENKKISDGIFLGEKIVIDENIDCWVTCFAKISDGIYAISAKGLNGLSIIGAPTDTFFGLVEVKNEKIYKIIKTFDRFTEDSSSSDMGYDKMVTAILITSDKNIFYTQGRYLYYLNIKNSSLHIYYTAPKDRWIEAIAITPDEKYIYCAYKNYIDKIDIFNYKNVEPFIIEKEDEENDILSISATNDGKDIVVSFKDIIKILDGITGKEKINLVFFKDNKLQYNKQDGYNYLINSFYSSRKPSNIKYREWVAYTNDGYYDCSSAAKQYVGFFNGDVLLDKSDNIYEQKKVYNLVSKILKNDIEDIYGNILNI